MPTTTPTPFTSPGHGSGWIPPTPETLNPLLPDYQIESLIGKGGMAAVYKGAQDLTNRPVAIKILPLAGIADSDLKFAERFEQEATTMAKLNHPAIVSVYGFGKAGSDQDLSSFLYLVMEFVQGADINEYIHAQGTEGRLPPEHALAITCHVLDGLAFAHEHGIIHRDIKPANVLLDQEGRVKIADFGLAKQIDGDARGLTVTNLALGTPDYVAPEALELGKSTDHRADLYATGVMLYQLLTGSIPRGNFKPPSLRVHGLDRRFDSITGRALQTEPEDRYQSATEFRLDLDAILTMPEASAQSGVLEQVGDRTLAMQKTARHRIPARKQASAKAQSEALSAPSKQKRLHPAALAAVVALPLLAIGAAVFFLLSDAGKPEPRADLPADTQSRDKTPETPRSADPNVAADATPKIPGPNDFRDRWDGGRELPATTDPTEANRERPFENTLGMRFVPAPIVAGPTDGQRVLVSIWETRAEDFRLFVTATNRKWDAKDSRPHVPAHALSHEEAAAFCEYLSRLEHDAGKLSPELEYRLPHQREWFCAALPPDKLDSKGDLYPWGTQWPPPKGQVWGNLHGSDDGHGNLSPVGSFPPNQYGIYDMVGSVREFTLTRSSDSEDRVIALGSAWNLPGNEITMRINIGGHPKATPDPTFRAENIGFRVVLAPVQSLPAPGPDATLTSSPANQKPTTPERQSIPVSSAGVDLLAHFDPSKLKRPNAWTREPSGAWTCDGVKGKNRTEFMMPVVSTVRPPYRLEVDLERRGEKPESNIIALPIFTRTAVLDIDSFPRGANALTRVWTVGQDGNPPSTDARHFYRDLTRRVRIDVTGPSEDDLRIHATIDGQTLVDWRGPESRLRQLDQSRVYGQFAFASHGHTKWRYHRVMLYPSKAIAGNPKPEAPGAKSEPPSPKPEAPSTETEAPAILASRLAKFEELRLQRVTEPYRKDLNKLAAGYTKAIGRAIDAAANSGDLSAVNALRAEKKRVASLRPSIGQHDAATLPALAPLPEDKTPGALLDLRRTWDGAVAKHTKTHDSELAKLSGQFRDSLKSFEAHLTKERRFEEANLVKDYRENFAPGDNATAKPQPSKSTEQALPPAPPGGHILAGQYRELPDKDPFPLQRVQRPTEPCRVVAWRIDGKPVDRAKIITHLGDVPDGLGEVVDFTCAHHQLVRSWVRPHALRANGAVVAMDPKRRPGVPSGAGFVKIAGIREVMIGLRQDGTCTAWPIDPSGGWAETAKAKLAEAGKWKDVVDISAGERHVAGLTASGTVLVASGDDGRDHRVPEGFRAGVITLHSGIVQNWLIKWQDPRTVVLRKWPEKREVKGSPSNRFFLNWDLWTYDPKRLVLGTQVAKNSPIHPSYLRGSRPRDVTNLFSAGFPSSDGDNLGIAAIREGRDDWRFWGDLGKVCEIDEKFCAERARQCRRIFLLRPYILALKPVAALTGDDWTGDESQRGGPLETAAADLSKIEALPQYRDVFPLPIVKRPTRRGRLEVYRRDGKPVGTQPDDNPLGKIPAGLGSNVVDVEIGYFRTENAVHDHGVVLLNDGTVRVWRAGRTFELEDPTFGLRDIVKVAAGCNHRTLMLNARGEIWAWGTDFGGEASGRAAKLPLKGIANISLSGVACFGLNQRGKVVLLNPQQRQVFVPDDLPPSIAIGGGFLSGFALGIDGNWRSWLRSSNSDGVLATWPSNGLSAPPRGDGDSVYWMDAKGRPQCSNDRGQSHMAGKLRHLRDSKCLAYFPTSNLVFLQTANGKWHIGGGGESTDISYITDKVQGAVDVAASPTYIFVVRPLGG